MGAETRKLGLEPRGATSEGVRGVSVKSMFGEGAWMLLNSDVWSVKMFATRLSIAGPAGYLNSEQAPAAPRVRKGWRLACARWISGVMILVVMGSVRFEIVRG